MIVQRRRTDLTIIAHGGEMVAKSLPSAEIGKLANMSDAARQMRKLVGYLDGDQHAAPFGWHDDDLSRGDLGPERTPSLDNVRLHLK